MKDLEKIKAEYAARLAEELKLAELENKYEKILGFNVKVFRCLGKIFVYGADPKNEIGLHKIITPHQGGIMLRAIKPDKKIVVNQTATDKGDITSYYHLMAERGFDDSCTILKVNWSSEGIEFSFKLKIDGEKILKPFFFSSNREMSSSERSTYKPVTRYGHIAKKLDLPIMRFQCPHITFMGGSLAATDVDGINEIIEAIKNA